MTSMVMNMQMNLPSGGGEWQTYYVHKWSQDRRGRL